MNAPSPFIEGTQIQYAVDSQSITAAKKCLKYYKYTIIDGYRKRDESVHLRFGGEFARWLEFYHKAIAAGLDHEEALDYVVAFSMHSTFDWHSAHPQKNRETLIRSLIWYLDHYKDDHAKTLILSDGRPAVELSFKIELPWEAARGQPYVYCGHIDRMVSYLDDPFVQDQKTTVQGVGPYFFSQFSPHGQMSGYTFAGKVIFDIPIAGVMIDGIKVATGYTEFARGFTNRTQGQTDEWIEDTRKWTELIRFAVEHDYWPLNDASCHHYGGCTFREVCSQDPKVRQMYLDTYFEKAFWNPLETR